MVTDQPKCQNCGHDYQQHSLMSGFGCDHWSVFESVASHPVGDDELLFPDGLTLDIQTFSGKKVCDLELSADDAEFFVSRAMSDYLNKMLILALKEEGRTIEE